MKRIIFFVGVLTAAGSALLLRFKFLCWGATQDEIRRALPGDDLVANTRIQCTRAITIQAPASLVWQWLMQIGQDRAGWYSYTWLENLFGANMHNEDRIIPEFQHREVGDKVWMADKNRFDGQAYATVALLEPEHAFVLKTRSSFDEADDKPSVWALVVEPIDAHTTRLIVRTHVNKGLRPWEWAINQFFWEPAHFIMERGMLLGIKERAETGMKPEAAFQPF